MEPASRGTQLPEPKLAMRTDDEQLMASGLLGRVAGTQLQFAWPGCYSL